MVAACALSAVAVAVAVRASTVRAFEAFVVEESADGLRRHATEYVRVNGTLEGFRPASPRTGRPLTPAGDAAASGARRPPPRQRPVPLGAAPHLGGGLPIPFGLADAGGRLILPFEGAPTGTVLPERELASGRALVVDGVRVGTVLVPEDPFAGRTSFGRESAEAGFLRQSGRALAWALGAALAFALGFAWWLAGRTVRPLRQLTEAVQDVASGELGRTVEPTGGEEIERLAEAFNAMSARLAEATALRQKMTADVAHDLRTPLSSVLATLEAIRDGVLPATPERLAAAHAEADRLGRLVRDLHTLTLADAREIGLAPRPVDAARTLRRLAFATEAAAERAGLTLSVEASGVLPVLADSDRLAQALGNLLGNAIRHTPPGGRVTMRARPAADGVWLEVADTGEGIPPEALPHVFERSVRGDAARSGAGSGLGLTIVRALAEAMGGRAAIASTLGHGTTASLWLPHAAVPATAAEAG